MIRHDLAKASRNSGSFVGRRNKTMCVCLCMCVYICVFICVCVPQPIQTLHEKKISKTIYPLISGLRRCYGMARLHGVSATQQLFVPDGNLDSVLPSLQLATSWKESCYKKNNFLATTPSLYFVYKLQTRKIYRNQCFSHHNSIFLIPLVRLFDIWAKRTNS